MTTPAPNPRRNPLRPPGKPAGNSVVKLVLLGLIWAFCHHFCAGIRFLFLDMHVGVDLPSARLTSKIAFVVSLALTVLLGAKLLW